MNQQNLCDLSILSLSLIIINSVQTIEYQIRVSNHFVKLKVCQLQLFTSMSNLNAINNTHYTVSDLRQVNVIHSIGRITKQPIIQQKRLPLMHLQQIYTCDITYRATVNNFIKHSLLMITVLTRPGNNKIVFCFLNNNGL